MLEVMVGLGRLLLVGAAITALLIGFSMAMADMLGGVGGPDPAVQRQVLLYYAIGAVLALLAVGPRAAARWLIRFLRRLF